MLVPLAAKWGTGGVFRRGLGRRQGHSEISLRRGHRERRPLSQGVDQEAASGIAVFRREYAAVKTASEGLGVQSVAKDLGILCGLNLHLDASATMCLVNRRGLGKAKHVDMQNLWIQEASKSGRFVTKKVGTSVNPADLMTKPLPKPKIEQLMSLMGYEFVKGETGALKGRAGGEMRCCSRRSSVSIWAQSWLD